MITQIKFVSIPVRDYDRSIAFFTEKLGFKVSTDQRFGESQRWVEMRVAGAETKLVLFTSPDQESRIGTFMPMSFQCDNVQKTYDELKARGVEFEQELSEASWGSFAIFKDPDGNRFVMGSK
jgi:predicted enzyme related to lactoylglutathione lyase